MEVLKEGSCAFIVMKNGRNTVNTDFIENFHKSLDQVENYEDVTCLVTVGEDKYFCLGGDPSILPYSAPFIEIVESYQKLVARLLMFPVVTVAAINGHCLGGGIMLALAHDFRIMREDRGWFGIPIVQFKRTMSHAFLQFTKSKCPQPSLHAAITLGVRYTASEAKSAGFIHQVSSNEDLKENAVNAAKRLSGDGLDKSTLTAIKHDLYKDVYTLLNDPCIFLSHL